MDPLLLLVLTLIIGEYLLESAADWLNCRSTRCELPREFADSYDPEQYRKSQSYLRESTRLELARKTVITAAFIAFLLLGGFDQVDRAARSASGWLSAGSVVTGLFFAGILLTLKSLLGLPFTIYPTFGIEQKYGFNTTTPRTFVGDLLKSVLLGSLLGAPILAAVFSFFETAGQWAWVYSWGAIVVFQLLVTFLAPVLILPLFNRFTPIEDPELKAQIERYALQQDFELSGIYTMDGSKRSTKANAFFSGFGRFRRLVFFDTLLSKHNREEILAVLAHEIGHFKKKHIVKFTLLSMATTGLVFYALSLLMMNEALFRAFRVEEVSTYGSLIFAAILYGPAGRLLSIPINALSRKFEFEADAFASATYGKPEVLVSALKKLSVDHLSHLTPHPLKVLLDYSHPPILERIQALRARPEASGAPAEAK